MPIIEISKKDLEALIGKKFSLEQLNELLYYVKGEIERIEDDTLFVEIKDINRPDLWSAGGIARELRGIIGKEKGLQKFFVEHSDYKVYVSAELKKIRPLTVCAVVKNLKLSSEGIRQLILLQEKLCENFGRKRKEAALGIYDADKIIWPVYYKTVLPEKIKFVPLDFSEEMTPKEIIQKHPQGQKYGKLLEGEKYPIFIDSANNVLSMPPIINSAHTGKITEETKNAFIEVTGFSFRFIVPVLLAMLTELSERGCSIYEVEINYGKKKIVTPNMQPKSIFVEIDYINKILGTSLTKKEIARLLEKSRMELKEKKGKNKKEIVEYGCYRQDIMHARDVAEEIAIQYGYNKLKAEIPKIATIGRSADFIEKREKIIELLVGLGMQEIATFTLTNKDVLFKKMCKKEEEIVEIENPVSSSYSCLRNKILPCMLEFLSKNITKEFPQRVFEIGEIVEVKEGKAKTKNFLCFVISHSKANFTEARQFAEYLLENLKIKYEIKEIEDESFIDGRTGSIIIGKKNVGVIGEIHPKILTNFGLEMPVSAFELELDKLT